MQGLLVALWGAAWAGKCTGRRGSFDQHSRSPAVLDGALGASGFGIFCSQIVLPSWVR